MRMDHVGTGSIPFKGATTNWLIAKSTSPWLSLGGAYKLFTLQAAKGSSVATSGFTVKLFGALSSASTAPLLLATCTSAARRAISTGNVPVTWIKFSSTKFTTAAGRRLRVETCALP